MEHLSKEVDVLTNELMERNKRMEELLVKMAMKQGIQCDTEESEMQ